MTTSQGGTSIMALALGGVGGVGWGGWVIRWDVGWELGSRVWERKSFAFAPTAHLCTCCTVECLASTVVVHWWARASRSFPSSLASGGKRRRKGGGWRSREGKGRKGKRGGGPSKRRGSTGGACSRVLVLSCRRPAQGDRVGGTLGEEAEMRSPRFARRPLALVPIEEGAPESLERRCQVAVCSQLWADAYEVATHV